MRRRAMAVLPVLVALACRAPEPLGTAPGFDLQDLAGGRVSLAALKGKVVVLDFWATWCGPCIADFPHFAELQRRNESRGVEVIGVVFDSGEPEEIQDFVREHRISYRQLLGDDQLKQAYGAMLGFPITFVIDGRGAIRYKTLGGGPDKFERFQQVVDAALAGR